ncbi:MAG: hypothetical protein WC083_04170 [Candidatus Methanomethylophilaceae archaeon]
MSSVFQKRAVFGGGFDGTRTKLVFAGFRSGLTFENIQVSYNQQIVRIWELDGGDGTTYMITGHAAGQGAISKVVGPSTLSNAFYQRYSDACRVAENNLMMEASVGCSADVMGQTRTFNNSVDLNVGGVLMGGMSLGAGGESPIIRQSMNMQFVTLDWNESGSNTAAA